MQLSTQKVTKVRDAHVKEHLHVHECVITHNRDAIHKHHGRGPTIQGVSTLFYLHYINHYSHKSDDRLEGRNENTTLTTLKAYSILQERSLSLLWQITDIYYDFTLSSPSSQLRMPLPWQNHFLPPYRTHFNLTLHY